MAKRQRAAGAKKPTAARTAQTTSYKHPEATTLLRPEVGTQAQFRKRKPPAEYRYDSSLSPALEWDGQNWARDLGAWLIRCIEDYARELQGGAHGSQSRGTPDHRQDAGATPVGSTVAGRQDAGTTSVGSTAAGRQDAGTTSVGSTAAGRQDAGTTSVGSTAAGRQDAGTTSVGSTAAGRQDAGTTSVGSTAAGRQDAGTTSADTTKEFKNGRGEVVATVRSLADAVEQLRRLEKPFLNWAGKAERLSFEVPTLPLFVHERLSTKAILETLKGHKRDKQMTMFELFGDPQHSVTDQILKAYEHLDNWVNRLILGDSLVVMNSLLKYEGLGGQVQMIYMDPPYGIKFGSNFQPFVRKRDVKHNDDADMTREPEMVKAYRDTWELGLHSYLTYMRDRLLLARELLHSSGSVFVQISDENLHHVRELLDETFGAENACPIILMRKSGWAASKLLPQVHDFVLWYARDRDRVKYRQLFSEKKYEEMGDVSGAWVESPDGRAERPLTKEEREDPRLIPSEWRLFFHDNLTSEGHSANSSGPIDFKGKQYWPGVGKRTDRHWKTVPEGIYRLRDANRLLALGDTLRQKRYFTDFPFSPLGDHWDDTAVSGFADQKLYVVQTNVKAAARFLLMSTDPGDLVLDPTCGSGTTVFVAEQWGRRWITCDTSRVPLALARQRLLTATFDYYELKDESRGPASGFVYQRKQNNKGEEVGGIVPHVTLKSIANNEPPDEEVLVDRPEVAPGKITRVTGPFVVEATIPTPIDWDNDGQTDTGIAASHDYASYVDRMIEVLRRSPLLHLGGNKTVTLKSIRPPAKTLSLSAEAMAPPNGKKGSLTLEDAVQMAAEEDGKVLPLSGQPVAIVFGPESGAVSEKTVYEAAREAHGKSYAHLYVIGFAIQPNARKLVDECEKVIGVSATYVQATPDLMMGDLLKNMRSSQIFSVCGLPEVRLRKADASELKKSGVDAKESGWYQTELLGLDVFDPGTMEVDHRPGSDVPCWMLDSDYNGLCFKATQVFFPRTAAWDDLKRALKTEYDDSVWEHLAGTTSTPFQIGEHGQVAVKVIDDRGNELLVVKNAKEAE